MTMGSFTIFSANKDDLRFQDLVGATLKAALVTSAYTPDATNAGHALWSEVSANEIAAGNGYTAGGLTLTGVTVTANSTDGWKITWADPTWTASGGNIPAWRYLVVYVSGALWGKTNPLVGYVLGDTTPADVPATSSGAPIIIQAPVAGHWASIA